MIKTNNKNITVRRFYQDGIPMEDISKVKVPEEIQIRILEKVYGVKLKKVDQEKSN